MIEQVDRTLLELLRKDVSDDAKARIAVISPEDAKDAGVQLGLFLYATIEDPTLKNEPTRFVDHGQRQQAPLTVDLYYMLTAYGPASGEVPSNRSFIAHRELSRGMRVFYDNGIITGMDLNPKLVKESVEALRVSLNPVTVEDMTRVWSVFPNQAYRPSVAYLVTPVPIPSKEFFSDTRVTEQRTHAGPRAAQSPDGGIG